MDRITLTMPDDWHLHLRDGDALKAVLADSARRFARAVVMPNLKPPVTTVDAATMYRDRILSALPPGSDFEPLMTLYLTDGTKPAEIHKAKAGAVVRAVKYYPAGATTNSDSGVTDIRKCFGVLEAMAETGMPLLIHGEVTDPQIDVFDREKVFIERTMIPLIPRLPGLSIVMEHITTANAVKFVLSAPDNVAASITAHHLLMNRNDIFQGGIRPHYYCLPILKREEHRLALIKAATSGSSKFFLGTDSAPHARHTKETNCGCAGIYTAHAGIELYAEAFDAAGRLEKLEAFASFHGADFYGLARNRRKITLVRNAWSVPGELPYGADSLVPLRGGATVAWKLE
ncbi:MAG TPA: dihydroorotase, partial [Burkholderiales bacterium]|nr:dihydroorotase [Burkholderiales bacterium]